MGTLIGGVIGAIATLAATILMWPKINAEARRANAQASQVEWQTLRDEIRRLDGELADVRKEFSTFKESAADEKGELERENKSLRTEIRRLKIRVQGLEEIFKIAPVTPEMQALLDEIDRKTAAGGQA